jgi:hypothetical protein
MYNFTVFLFKDQKNSFLSENLIVLLKYIFRRIIEAKLNITTLYSYMRLYFENLQLTINDFKLKALNCF